MRRENFGEIKGTIATQHTRNVARNNENIQDQPIVNCEEEEEK